MPEKTGVRRFHAIGMMPPNQPDATVW